MNHRELSIGEVEINIKNIIQQCVKKWAFIVGIAIFVAIVLSAVMYYRDVQNYNAEINKDNSQIIELSNAEKIGIDYYVQLENKIEQLMEYREAAIVMNIDFSNACHANLQYMLVGNEDLKEDIVAAVLDYVNNGALISDLQSTGAFAGKKYVQEIVSAKLSPAEEIVENGIISVEVYGETEEACKAYTKEISNKINEYAKTLEKAVGNYKLQCTKEAYTMGYSVVIYELQQEYIQTLRTTNSEYQNQKNSMNERQIQEINQMHEEDSESTENYQQSLESPSVDVKIIVIGLFLGLVVGIIIVCLVTIFNGKLQSSGEIQRRFAVVDFGAINKKSESVKEQLDLAALKINMFMQNKEISEIVFIGTSKYALSAEMAEMAKYLSVNGNKCIVAGNVLLDQQALKKLTSNCGVVLIEEVSKSKIQDIYEEYAICKNIDLSVVGYITVSE